jgi:hypothetical protein
MQKYRVFARNMRSEIRPAHLDIGDFYSPCVLSYFHGGNRGSRILTVRRINLPASPRGSNDRAKPWRLFGPNFKWEGATRGARLSGAVLFDPAPGRALVRACMYGSYKVDLHPRCGLVTLLRENCQSATPEGQERVWGHFLLKPVIYFSANRLNAN